MWAVGESGRQRATCRDSLLCDAVLLALCTVLLSLVTFVGCGLMLSGWGEEASFVVCCRPRGWQQKGSGAAGPWPSSPGTRSPNHRPSPAYPTDSPVSGSRTRRDSFSPSSALFNQSNDFVCHRFQGLARPSAAGSLRTAGYRGVSRAMLQLGDSAAPHLGTPALPALLAEVRGVVAASDPRFSEAGGGGKGGGGVGAADMATTPGATVGSSGSGGGGGGGGKRGMGIEPAMSARKSSQKKQRRSREKEVGRALAAADAAAAATATAAGCGAAVGGGGGGGGGMVWTGAAALAEREAVCAALSSLSQVVVCCRGHLPLGGRLAVEDVLHRGLELLAHAGTGGSKGSSGVGGGDSSGGGGGRSGGACRVRLEDPHVALEFFGLAQACLVTPLVRAMRF